MDEVKTWAFYQIHMYSKVENSSEISEVINDLDCYIICVYFEVGYSKIQIGFKLTYASWNERTDTNIFETIVLLDNILCY